MVGISKRHAAIALAGIASIAIVFFALQYSSERDPFLQISSDCRKAPTSTCLVDLGVGQLRQKDSTLDSDLNLPIDYLITMNRIEDAQILIFRNAVERGLPTGSAEEQANTRVASARLARSIRQGTSLDQAMVEQPNIDQMALSIAAQHLVGQTRFGAFRGPDYPVNENLTNLAKQMAAKIVEMDPNARAGPRAYYLSLAAGVEVVLGDREAAINYLQQIPGRQETINGYSKEMVRSLGAETALQFMRDTGTPSPEFLFILASVEKDPARVRDHLTEAFQRFATEWTRPHYQWMAVTISACIALNQRELGLSLAQQTQDMAKAEGEDLLFFDHLYVIDALVAAGAPIDEIRENLNGVKDKLPAGPQASSDPNPVPGYTYWFESHLDGQARRHIARIHAKLGDVEEAKNIAYGFPPFTHGNPSALVLWLESLEPGVSVEHLNRLFVAARGGLSDADVAYVKARMASLIIAHSRNEPAREWAMKAATDLLAEPLMAGANAANAYGELVELATHAEDLAIRQIAIDRLTAAAFHSRDGQDLIRAGFEHNRQDNS
jgi:hypothetical protein